jgi:type II secretory pathway pseudopilin PulG
MQGNNQVTAADAVNATTTEDVTIRLSCDNDLDGNRNLRESGLNDKNHSDNKETEIAGKTIHFEVLSRFTNNLTVDVDEPTLAHHHDVLTTMSPLTGNVNNNNNNTNSNNNNDIGTNSSTIGAILASSDMGSLDTTISSTAQGSDESTVTSSSSGNTNRASSQPSYQKEADGTIKPYVNLKELCAILANYPDLDLDNL